MPCDYRKYPPTWRSEIVPRIRARAGDACETCGVGNKTVRDGKRIVLTTAHLDRDPENWEVSDERLRLLCQRCHLNYDRDDNTAKKRYGKGFREQPTLFEY